MADELIVVSCSFCDKPTVRGASCKHCGKTLTGHEMPYQPHFASADTKANLGKPLALGLGASALLFVIGFGKVASLLAVGTTIYCAIKYLRSL